MQCREASELMSLRFDSDLSLEEEEALRGHVGGCDRCRAEWSWMQRADALFEGATMVAPPPLLKEAVMARVQRRAAWMVMLRGGMILGLGIVILLGMVMVPMAVFSWPVSTVSSNPAAVSAIVGAFVRIAGILATLLEAAHLVLRSLASSPSIAMVVLYALGAAGLALWWLRVVAGPGALSFRKRSW